MALIECKECSKDVSTDANTCPHCGCPQKKGCFDGFFNGCSELGCVFLVLLIFIIPIANMSQSSNEENKNINSQVDPQVKKIKDQFSSWDGSHRKITKHIKQQMHDPESYEHVKTNYANYKDYLIVNTTFRGKNAFGGIVLNFFKAKVDLEGNILEIMESR